MPDVSHPKTVVKVIYVNLRTPVGYPLLYTFLLLFPIIGTLGGCLLAIRTYHLFDSLPERINGIHVELKRLGLVTGPARPLNRGNALINFF